eukprot:scaffold45095_cov48-Phaeocystis_antarctica.AAC.3
MPCHLLWRRGETLPRIMLILTNPATRSRAWEISARCDLAPRFQFCRHEVAPPPPLTIPMTGADESHTAGAGVRTSSRQALLCATPPRSKGARVARHAQGESSNAREQTAAVDKVVQDTLGF